MYKPHYKVAHKTVTELEWRCCPGYSGFDCMEGHPVYQHPMKMMPPFKGPPMKGPPMMKGPPPFKGPMLKGPQFKGPQFKGPMFKGPPINAVVKANPWMQRKGPPTGRFNSCPMCDFGPPRSPTYPESSFNSYPPQPEPMPEPMPEHQETHHTEHEQELEHEHEHELGQGPEEHLPEEPLPSTSGGEQPEEGAIGRPKVQTHCTNMLL